MARSLKSLAMLLGLALTNPAALADSNGEFPGQGDYDDWKKSSNLADEGIELAKRGNLRQAIGLYNQAIHIYAHDGSVYYNKGIAQKKLGDFAAAIESFREATRLEPGFASAWYNLGNAYDSADKHVDAEKAFREAVRLDPGHFNAWFNLGVSLFKQARYAQADEAFNHATKLAANQQDRDDIAAYKAKLAKKLGKPLQ